MSIGATCSSGLAIVVLMVLVGACWSAEPPSTGGSFRFAESFDPATGTPVANLQRLETFGSPAIGWVDVVVDTALAEPFRFEPNVTPRWLWW